MVKLLLDNHAEVADQDLMGNTGLHYACYTGKNYILILDKNTEAESWYTSFDNHTDIKD